MLRVSCRTPILAQLRRLFNSMAVERRSASSVRQKAAPSARLGRRADGNGITTELWLVSRSEVSAAYLPYQIPGGNFSRFAPCIGLIASWNPPIGVHAFCGGQRRRHGAAARKAFGRAEESERPVAGTALRRKVTSASEASALPLRSGDGGRSAVPAVALLPLYRTGWG